ncbi:MAG: redoxin domain-containing protein [Bacteroidetes bacterium]|nr:redoxin domain-containing protein [Bacteroidota bacterium]
MSLSVGQAAPDFTLYDSEKNKVTLSELRGKNVLLMFFPQSFTGVCTQQVCTARDNMTQYEQAKATVLGISVDSVFTLAKFKELQNLNFSLLSDFNKEVSRAYGSLYDEWILDMKGVSKRAAFVIDANGIVQYAEVLDNPGNLPDFQKIQDVLSRLC